MKPQGNRPHNMGHGVEAERHVWSGAAEGGRQAAAFMGSIGVQSAGIDALNEQGRA
jgi:hypothetical protein